MTATNDWDLIKQTLVRSAKMGQQISTILNDYHDISYEEAKQLADYKHGAHVMIWAKNPTVLWTREMKAAILMQMRFDGCLGFPGGLVSLNDVLIHRKLKKIYCYCLKVARG